MIAIFPPWPISHTIRLFICKKMGLLSSKDIVSQLCSRDNKKNEILNRVNVFSDHKLLMLSQCLCHEVNINVFKCEYIHLRKTLW